MDIRRYEAGHMHQVAGHLELLGSLQVGNAEVRFPPIEFLHDAEAAEPVGLGEHGRIYTHTTVHPAKSPAYSLAMVDFDHGIRAFGRLLVDADTHPEIGDRVRVVSFELAGGTMDYAFESIESRGAA
jgi:uncharacterized OB-fold protein